MKRLALAALLLGLSGCASIPVATIGVVAGVIVNTEQLDVKLIDLYLASKGMKSAPTPEAPNGP